MTKSLFPIKSNISNRNILTEFTTGNLAVNMDSEFFTPPQSCGLLAYIPRSFA